MAKGWLLNGRLKGDLTVPAFGSDGSEGKGPAFHLGTTWGVGIGKNCQFETLRHHRMVQKSIYILLSSLLCLKTS